ncbi:hypothetical protein G6F43_012924 [Rhizopus delemar]|nr:hypothetical protein G6F43_012924 [Rhizopus delemar]
MTAATKADLQDWMQKIQFGKTADVDLQIQKESESIKIEIDEIPNNDTGQDEYLKAILSSKPNTSSVADNKCLGGTSCTCYKCQRQRRREGGRSNTTPITPPLKGIAPKRSNTLPTPKRSNTVRKTPTLKSYEKHMPKPIYSQQDSIYRFNNNHLNNNSKIKKEERHSTVIDRSSDNYEISWKDDGTGDDLLTSLVTFQTIFETADQNEGLSDLLEQKTKELKEQKLKKPEIPKQEDGLPPRRPDCLTLSYRQGSQHYPLTLYHTMKMITSKERANAYKVAFEHCIQSDSGLRHWIKRTKIPPPTRESITIVQAVNQKPRRSIFSSIRRNYRFSRQSEEQQQLFWTTNGHMEENNIKSKSKERLKEEPTDILLAAQALLPNQQEITIRYNNNKTSYEYIDIPGKPRDNQTGSSDVN